jgi:hypothetical protein
MCNDAIQGADAGRRITFPAQGSGDSSGPPTGCFAQKCCSPCPAWVTNAVFGAIAVPSGDSPIGQWQSAFVLRREAAI